MFELPNHLFACNTDWFSTRISHISQRVFPRPERVIIISSFLCICEVLYTKPLFLLVFPWFLQLTFTMCVSFCPSCSPGRLSAQPVG